MLWCLVAALPLLAACQSTEDANRTATPAASTATETPTPPTTFTPTPACDEKCELLRTFTPLPTATIQPPPVVYPAGTRTGVAEVDAIINAIETNDADRLANLISLTTLPCRAQGNVQPEALLCREGVAPGTPKTGVWVTHVEGGLRETTQAEMANDILRGAAERAWQLHSVYSYETGLATPDWMPETDYFITFGFAHPQVGAEYDNLRIVDGRITAIHFAFGEPDSAWLNPDDPGWLLPRAR